MAETEENKRTNQQSRSLHLLFRQISDHCVAHGIDQKTVVNQLRDFPVPISEQFVKESWRAMQIALTGKKSTTELTKQEIQNVYEVFNKFWSEMAGAHFAFPSWQMMTLGE